MCPKKIRSVLELSKYKIGDTAYYISLVEKIDSFGVEPDDQWMLTYHPKILFSRRGPGYKVWPKHNKLPKLEALSFSAIIDLLTADLSIIPMEISHVERSLNTGEFIYDGDNGANLPEDQLFDSIRSANKELVRIKKLIQTWAS